MVYRTHLSLGFATAGLTVFLPEAVNPFYYIDNPMWFPIIMCIVFVSSLAPDFDEPESYLSKRAPWSIVSRILSAFTTHRGVTHYFIASFVWFLIFLVLAYVIFKQNIFWLAPFFILPYMSHSLGDGFTKGGVPRFMYPFSKKTFWTLPKPLRFYTGSFPELIWFLIFTAVFIFEIFYLITTKANIYI